MSSRYEERDDRYRSDDRRRDRDRDEPASSDRHRTRDREVDDREARRYRKDDDDRRKGRSDSRSRSRERHSKRRRDRSESRDRGEKDKKKRHRSVPPATFNLSSSCLITETTFIQFATNPPHSSRSPSPHSLKKAEKKAAKAARRREAELQAARQVAEISMYTAEDNPFGDSNLGQQFKWVKKREQEKKLGISDEEAARRDQVRRLEAKEELERLNKRRAEREVEMQLREEEEARLARLAESAQMAEWVAKEDDFQLEQSRRRAGIRMRENRAKAIDFLAINLRFADPTNGGDGGARAGLTGPGEEDVWGWEDAGLEWDIDEPWLIFENLTLEDMEELSGDIKMYLSLEKAPVNIEFWEVSRMRSPNKICLASRVTLTYIQSNPTRSAWKRSAAIGSAKNISNATRLSTPPKVDRPT